MSSEKLTLRQQNFILEYLTDFNATQAAIRAGYSQKWANKTGPKLLKKKNIQKQINKIKMTIKEEHKEKINSIVDELYNIIFTYSPSFIDVDHTNNTFKIKEPDNINDLRIIESLTANPNGFKLTLRSKIKAIELLIKLIDIGAIQSKTTLNFSTEKILRAIKEIKQKN